MSENATTTDNPLPTGGDPVDPVAASILLTRATIVTIKDAEDAYILVLQRHGEERKRAVRVTHEALTRRMTVLRRIAHAAHDPGVLYCEPDAWGVFEAALMGASVPEELAVEETAAIGNVWGWQFVSARLMPMLDYDEIETVDGGPEIFIRDGRTYVQSVRLARWIMNTRGEPMTVKALAPVMRAAGCKPYDLDKKRPEGGRVRGSYWRLIPEVPG